MSDIHLELYKKLKCIPYIKPSAPYLALCGDIGYPFSDQYSLFLHDCSKKFKMVFLLSGNHEYYQNKSKRRSMNAIETKIKELSRTLGNVYYLQNSYVLLDKDQNLIYYGDDYKLLNENIDSVKYLIAGSTLWTFIPEIRKLEILEGMNDYKKIYMDSETTKKLPNVDVDTINNLHKISTRWIEGLLVNISKLDIKLSVLMLSHHAPSDIMLISNLQEPGKSRVEPSGLYTSFNCAYASNLEYLFDGVKIWISGHTHLCLDKMVNQTVLLSNCKGYVNELSKKFSEDKIAHLV